MENYVWLAIATGASFVIFLIWIYRGRRQGEFSRPGRDEPAGVLVETALTPPSIGGERPSA